MTNEKEALKYAVCTKSIDLLLNLNLFSILGLCISMYLLLQPIINIQHFIYLETA